MFTYEQQVAFDKYLTGDNLFITGAGGVGKSYLINRIVEDFKEKLRTNTENGFGIGIGIGNGICGNPIDTSRLHIGITALTGVAACLINGSTIHSRTGIGLGGKSVPELVKKIRKKSELVQMWKMCKLLIIDEISMMTPELFEKLHHIGCIIRSREPRSMVSGRSLSTTLAGDQLFGGIQVIVCGDFAQLPPVEKGKLVTFAFQSPIWKKYLDKNTVYLTESVRHTDPKFQAVLAQVRMGELTTTGKSLLKNRLYTVERFKTEMKKRAIKPTLLYPHRATVDEINNQKLTKLIDKGRECYTFLPEWTFLVHPHLDIAKKRELRFKYKKILKEEDMLEYPSLSGNRGNVQLDLCVGAQVILTHNIDVTLGLANGTRGIITDFIDNGQTGNKSELCPQVRFDNGGVLTLERKSSITEVVGVDLIVNQFPLQLAWSQTIHKSQGSTISVVACDLSNCFSPGQAYVALSRCRDLSGLYILGLNFSLIQCHYKVKEYYQRFSYKCIWGTGLCRGSWKECSNDSRWAFVKSCDKCFLGCMFQKFGPSVTNMILKMIESGNY